MSVLRHIPRPLASPRIDPDTHQRAAAEFLERTPERRLRGERWFLRHPIRSVKGFALLHALPALQHTSAGSAEAAAVRRGLLRGPRLRRAAIGGATAVLVLPPRIEDYLVGASKQTLRRKIRTAERLGVTWRPITDARERHELLRVLDESERTNARAQYCNDDPQNDDLLDIAHWLAAFALDGRPVLLAVTPIDGEWAVLRTFRALDDSAESSAARYLMSRVLAERLIGYGIRYLADSQSPASLPPGPRFFQRIIGYRMMRVRLGP